MKSILCQNKSKLQHNSYPCVCALTTYVHYVTLQILIYAIVLSSMEAN